MASMPAETTGIVGGVDTHQDLHTAAIVNREGAVLGTESFSTTRVGYRAMLAWFRSHGELLRVGVESTGSYGAGIARHLALSGVPVLEVTGPDPAARRAKGKDDALDAVAAAEAARTGCRVQVAKDRARWRPCGCCARLGDRGQVPPGGPAQLHNTICATRSATSLVCLRIDRTTGYGGRDQALAEVPRSQGPRQRRDRQARPFHRSARSPPIYNTKAQDSPMRASHPDGASRWCGACPLPASSGKTQRHRLKSRSNFESEPETMLRGVPRTACPNARSCGYVALPTAPSPT